MNGEQLFLEKTQIVFVCDTAPFGLRPARFATLYPLMTLDGKELSVDEKTFPNRGRVWWKLREGINEEHVRPGVLWSGCLVEAMGYEQDEDKDRYQVPPRDIVKGHKDLIEILGVEEESPSLDYVRRGKTLDMNRPVSNLVFLRGQTHVLGPLRSSWDSEAKALSFVAEDLQDPKAYLIPIEKFASKIQQRAFDVPMNQYHTHESYFTMPLALTKTDWATPEKLATVGKVIDAATDEQIINWAAKSKVVNLSNAQRTLIKNVIPAFQNIEGADEARMEHLRKIANDLERLEGVGTEVISALINADAFKTFTAEHIDQLADRRIAAEVVARRAEIEAELEDLTKQRKKLAQDVKSHEKELSKARETHDKELASKEEKLLKSFEKRQKELDSQQSELDKKEKMVQQQIDKAIETFRSESGKAVESLLVQMPLLQAMGLFGTGQPSSAPVAIPETNSSSPEPTFSAPRRTIKNAVDAISEDDFLDQFRKVVVAEGFYFQDDDLLNFHTCMKSGGLTVLAGMSGTGKSSLPRLYSQALGFSDEYLNISVRPDWLDDRELVGAYNPIAQCFEPGRVGLIDSLVEANLDYKAGSGGLYLYNLDEANLARIEHYFAQFLSVMELPSDRQKISLYPKGAVLRDDPYRDYQQIQLYPNMRWTATINVDETVHFLSPKLLDRSQIISLTGNGLTAARLAKSQPKESVEPTPVPLAAYTLWSQQTEDSKSALETLMQIHEVLKPARLGFEHRSLDRMLGYIDLAKKYLTEDKAIDFQVAQVVFPKLRRTAPGFHKVLEDLHKVITPELFPRSAQLLNRIANAEHEEEFFQLL